MSVTSTRLARFNVLDNLTVRPRCQARDHKLIAIVRLRCIIYPMGDEEGIRKLLSEIGRRGGIARAKALTAKQRKENAIKASKAAAKARTRKAKERKAQHD